jgi:hypothetical protein
MFPKLSPVVACYFPGAMSDEWRLRGTIVPMPGRQEYAIGASQCRHSVAPNENFDESPKDGHGNHRNRLLQTVL